jgi:hypothetical protein
MKVFVKILILVLALTLAIGGVMIYAKTKVEPPKAPHQTNQYLNDLSRSYGMYNKKINALQEDSVLFVTINRISIFVQENKITKNDADKGTDVLLGKYVPLFLNRSFANFKHSEWHENDHQYMLSIINSLRQIKHSDGNQALRIETKDSLAKIETIIRRYKQARAVSKQTHFSGVANAQNAISQARQFANDSWLSNCTDLVRDLHSVRSSLAESHYNYVSSMIEKLTQYRSYSKNYYDNTLVPQVDAVVTEYDKKASALYGSKKDVDALWNLARNYYKEGSKYFENN